MLVNAATIKNVDQQGGKHHHHIFLPMTSWCLALATPSVKSDNQGVPVMQP